MLYPWIKLLHVFLAITAIGANLTYAVWFARVNAEPAFAPFALRTIKLIDDRIANPAYLLLLPSGALMVRLSGLSFSTLWIWAAMTLWLIAMVVAYAFYTPTLTRQIAAVAREGLDGPQARALETRGQILAAFLAALVFAIVILMVFKPASF